MLIRHNNLFLLSLVLFFSLTVAACGSGNGAGGGGGGTGGGVLGGSSPGIRGPGVNAPNDPVRPGTGGVGGGTGGGSGGGGAGGGAANPIPNDAIEVTINVPRSGGQTEVNFNGSTNAQGRRSLLINILNPDNNSTGGLSLQSLVFNASQVDFITENFALAGGGNLVNANDSPSKTLAVVLSPPISRNVNALTYPTRGRDLPLAVGQYIQRLFFQNAPSTNFTGRLVLKNDPSFQTGTIKVNLFIDGQANQRYINDILASVDIYREIYGRVGITLDVISTPRPSASSNLPNPPIGSTMYESLAQSIPNRIDAVNVFIASSIGDLSTPSSVLGVSGGIPGSYFPSVKSAVAISLDAHLGIDGNLDSQRQRVLAETIAHEVGHYLGLFHPVEINQAQPDAFQGEDPLGDTPFCFTIAECNAIGLSNNLMFPTATGTVQQNLTPEQADVMNIQPLVR